MSGPQRAEATCDDEVFDAYPAPTMVVDAAMRVLTMNRAARASLHDGALVSRLVVARVGDGLACTAAAEPGGCGGAPSCQDCVVRAAVHHALATGTVRRAGATLAVRRGDGSDEEECVLVSASPIRREGRRRVVLTFEDVSEFVRLRDDFGRAVRVSRENESLSRTLFDLAPSGVVLLDGEGRILEFNEQAHRDLGYDRDEFARLRVSDLNPDESLGDVGAHIARVFAEGGAEFDTRHRARDGSVRQVLVRARPVELGGALRLVSVWQDITERKRAEEALRWERDINRSVAQNAAEAIFVTDEEARVTFANREAERVFGFTAEELRGRLLHDAIHHHHPDGGLYPARDCPRRKVYRLGETLRDHQDVFFRKDGSPVTVACSSAPLQLGGGRIGAILIVRDETETRRLQEQLRQSQRLESVGRLAGGIAHDFNNLLTVILSCSEDLRRTVQEGASPELEVIEDLTAAGRRARDLTNQLLTFARRQEAEPVTVDLGAMVHGMEKLLRRALGEKIELVTSAGPGLWPVQCDPGQLEQVLMNLAVNARDAMSDGGRLSIETANVELDAARGEALRGLRAGPHVRLTIEDTGHGMPLDVRERIFEPFFTTKPVGKGTGLGLAMVYGIVTQGGGSISVDSAPGRGTRFDLFFPRREVASTTV